MNTDQQITNLLRKYMEARSAYESYIRADPEMLAATDEAEILRQTIADTWNVYYTTGYPEGTQGEKTDQQELAAYQRAVGAAKDEIAALRRRAEQAERDAAALRQALVRWIDADGTLSFPEEDERLAELAQSLKSGADHPDAALLAELEAARAENAFLREWLRGELTITDADIDETLKASDL